MKKIDAIVLEMLHRVSNWTYRKAKINNYSIAIIIIVIAVMVSVCIAYYSVQLANLDKDPKMAGMRKASSFMAGILFAGMALVAIRFEKPLSDFLSRKYDLGMTEDLFIGVVIFFRWYFVFMYPISILIGSKWWNMLDVFLFGIAMLFLSCEPPDMEIRMTKIWKG